LNRTVQTPKGGAEAGAWKKKARRRKKTSQVKAPSPPHGDDNPQRRVPGKEGTVTVWGGGGVFATMPIWGQNRLLPPDNRLKLPPKAEEKNRQKEERKRVLKKGTYKSLPDIIENTEAIACHISKRDHPTAEKKTRMPGMDRKDGNFLPSVKRKAGGGKTFLSSEKRKTTP